MRRLRLPFEAINRLLMRLEVVAHHQFTHQSHRQKLQSKQAQQNSKYQQRAMLNKKLHMRENLLNEQHRQNRRAARETDYSRGPKEVQWPQHVAQHKSYRNQVEEHPKGARNSIMRLALRPRNVPNRHFDDLRPV